MLIRDGLWCLISDNDQSEMLMAVHEHRTITTLVTIVAAHWGSVCAAAGPLDRETLCDVEMMVKNDYDASE